ncbi:MAG: zinc ribbon domain-containing protein [Firmicutes bacterium]|nr:zinc ribbon domain-containing protein [Bacillota bacterium]
MFCRNCGENIPVDSVFCPNCGKNLLQIGAASPAYRQAPQAADEDEESEPASRLFGWRKRTREPVETDISAPQGEASVEEDSGPVIDLTPLKQLSFGRLLWGMGLLFGVVGFVVGLFANTSEAIVWMFFGLLLIVAAPHAPKPAPETQPEEMRD